ncbi:MAG: hypothetical protein HC789_10980 [Microcoleus sp. CSU_2_2]|nr:hypothetical protein [Microcoleus sp. CSU_2_2]
MRRYLKSLKKATIDRRRTLPLVFGCVTTLNPSKNRQSIGKFGVGAKHSGDKL